jgi:hypothetical protein
MDISILLLLAAVAVLVFLLSKKQNRPQNLDVNNDGVLNEKDAEILDQNLPKDPDPRVEESRDRR